VVDEPELVESACGRLWKRLEEPGRASGCEAEICYATLALVTDYDSWHPDHDSVTVDLIVATLLQNAATAKRVIAEAVSHLGGERTCACKDALASAIITRPEHIPADVKAQLAPLVGRYL
jgi:5'-methylthioadenosine phosphorylase